MSAIRPLAVAATDNGLLAPELRAGGARGKSAKSTGQVRQLAHSLAGAGAPERAGHHHRRGAAPRHHHEAQRVPRVAGAALSFHSARLTISIRRVPVSATAAAPSTNPSASAAPILCRSSKGMKRAPSGVTSSAPHGRAETRPPPPPPPSLSSFLPPPPPKADRK